MGNPVLPKDMQGPHKHVLYLLLGSWGRLFLQLASCVPSYWECL